MKVFASTLNGIQYGIMDKLFLLAYTIVWYSKHGLGQKRLGNITFMDPDSNFFLQNK